MEVPPYMLWDENHPDYERTVKEFYQGSYQSSWMFLIHAARANLSLCQRITSKLIEGYRQAVKKKQRPAEACSIIDAFYSLELSGPLLGSILATSAAIDAFLRIGKRAFLEKDLSAKERAEGVQPGVQEKLTQFDKLSSAQRLGQLYQDRLGKQDKDKLWKDELWKEFKYLVKFRNENLHADPAVRMESGEDQTVKGGKALQISLGEGEYPFLWASTRPLSLTHAVRAAKVHDTIVQDLLEQSPRVRDLLDVSEATTSHLIMTPAKREKLETVGLTWDLVDEKLRGIPLKEKRLFVLEMIRDCNIRPVK